MSRNHDSWQLPSSSYHGPASEQENNIPNHIFIALQKHAKENSRLLINTKRGGLVDLGLYVVFVDLQSRTVRSGQ